VRLQFGSDGQFVEATAPAELASHEVTVLDVYGSLLFAGARTLQTRLPGPSGCERPVVVHGRTTLGATGFIVLADYAERLRTSGGHLFLNGVAPQLLEQLQRTHRVDLRDAVTVVPGSETMLASTVEVYHEAETWLARSVAWFECRC